ncbi:MAG: hypothetical protein J6M53_06635 [Bacteroidaceae bacterium]|nr:hypothetical protein [Bacteroidaceae bacterium]
MKVNRKTAGLALLGLCLGGVLGKLVVIYTHPEPSQEQSVAVSAVDDSLYSEILDPAARAVADSIAKADSVWRADSIAREEDKARRKEIAAAYVKKLGEIQRKLDTENEGYYERRDYIAYYYLHDISKDGVPELWVTAPFSSPVNEAFYVYAYNKKLEQIYTDEVLEGGFHFAKDNGSMVCYYWAYDEESFFSKKISYKNNKLQCTLIAKGDYDDYTSYKPQGQIIEYGSWHPYNDIQPIYKALAISPTE